MKEVGLLVVLFAISFSVLWFWEVECPPDWQCPIAMGIIQELKGN